MNKVYNYIIMLFLILLNLFFIVSFLLVIYQQQVYGKNLPLINDQTVLTVIYLYNEYVIINY